MWVGRAPGRRSAGQSRVRPRFAPRMWAGRLPRRRSAGQSRWPGPSRVRPRFAPGMWVGRAPGRRSAGQSRRAGPARRRDELMGPHPAVAAVRAAVRPVLTGLVAVACSGGADSLALAAAVAFEARRHAVPAALVTVDHGLQDGSEAQARAVAALGYELGFDPVEVVRVRVGRAGGREAAARTARYAALDDVAAAL